MYFCWKLHVRLLVVQPVFVLISLLITIIEYHTFEIMQAKNEKKVKIFYFFPRTVKSFTSLQKTIPAPVF